MKPSNRNKLAALTIPASLLSATIILHTTQAQSPLAFFAAALLPLAAIASKRPRTIASLPLNLLALFLLSPAGLRGSLLASPPSAAIMLMVAALSTATIAATFTLALGGRQSLQRWSRILAIERPTGIGIARAELLLAWFALVRWRRAPSDRTSSDHPPGATPYACTASGTDLAMAWVFAGSALVEAPVFHVVIRHFSAPIAWTTTALSIGATLYLVGFAKSLVFWPTLLFEDRLTIRLGAVASHTLLRSNIDQVRLVQGQTPRTPNRIRLFAFDKPNIAVHAGGREYLFRVDRPQHLLAELCPP